LWQRAVPLAIIAPGGQSRNFWIHPCMCFQPITKEEKLIILKVKLLYVIGSFVTTSQRFLQLQMEDITNKVQPSILVGWSVLTVKKPACYEMLTQGQTYMVSLELPKHCLRYSGIDERIEY
jgi:hypothetical protein